MNFIVNFTEFLVLNFLEERQYFVLHLFNRKSWHHNSCNSIGTILPLIEISQILLNFVMGKGIVITNAVVVIGPTSKMLQNFPFSAVVFSESQHTFLMYSLSLFFDTTACEQSFHEEITYPFSCLYKFIIGNLELIICFIIWCVCIIVTRVQSNELWVLIEFGEFSWAHEQHMLQKMGDS